ncbi:hypothetical protein Q3G72_014944 [Acer saccharum]|nr:hypothetical protein Q3G72_014944 [Acer saccharum]
MMDSNLGFDGVGSAKRAKAESDCLGRNDLVNNTERTEAMGSFKSKLMNMASPSTWAGSVPDEPATSNTGMDKSEKEMPAFGPWLLVSYGKQGNCGYKGRNGKVGNSNVCAPMTNASNGKSSDNGPSNIKKSVYASANNMGGKAHQMKNETKPSNQNLCTPSTSVSSGSRFEVLSEEVDVPMVDSGGQNSNISVEGVKKKGKTILTEITNHKSSHNK